MSISDLFDAIAERARTDTEAAVRTYRNRQRALEERLRIAAENADHRRGSTREAIAARGVILLPADDIDLSPHTPAADAPVGDESRPVLGNYQEDNDQEDDDHEDDDHEDDDQEDTVDFSFSNGWLTDR